MARLIAALYRFRGHSRGNVLMIFAFAMIPMVFATAMGVDYARAARLQTKMNALADAAALAAVTQPMMKQTAGSACDVSRNTFTTQSAPLADQGLVFKAGNAKQFTITVSDTVPKSAAPVDSICQAAAGSTSDSGSLPLSRTATVKYTAASTNSFGGILGMATLPISGTATASTTLAPYIDIYMALDTSQSMGLAATTTDAAALYQKTGAENGEACTFGCHVPKTFQKVPNDSIAAKYNIQLRIDVLKAATMDMIQTAKSDQGIKDLYRFGLYQFGQSLSDIYTIGTRLNGTDNIRNDGALNKAKVLTLGPNTSAGNGDSNIDDMISKMYSRITIHGDGTKPETARAFLFIVTDGLHDMCNNTHCTHVIDPAQCQRYKDAGITVGIVYTTYLPIMANPGDPNNKNLQSDYIRLVVSPGLDKKLSPNLEQCASPGWFFQASDGPAIHTAMQKLFTQASQIPALTN
ncbi:hypothetical protein EAH79_05910 [Sphingomonas koreensis]|nr:hypothetical protein EAH79_05910 [Sphingomonas koreensis]